MILQLREICKRYECIKVLFRIRNRFDLEFGKANFTEFRHFYLAIPSIFWSANTYAPIETALLAPNLETITPIVFWEI